MPTRRRFLRDSAAWLTVVRSVAWVPSREPGSAGLSGRDQSSDFDVIVVGAGSSGCVIAQPAQRQSADARARHRGWRPRCASADSDSRQVDVAARHGCRLELHDRARAGPGRSTAQVAAREGLRRVEQHQRDGLRARPSALLRRVGGRGRARVELSRSAAALPPRRRTTRVAPPTTTAAAGRWPSRTRPIRTPDTSRFSRPRASAGFSARADWDFNGARQENGAGYYQKNIKDGQRHSAASAFLQPVAVAAEPRRLVEHAGAPADLRGQARGRRRGPARRQARNSPRGARDRARGRHARIAEAADAVRHRPCRRAQEARAAGRRSICLASARICTIIRASASAGPRVNRSRRRRSPRGCSRTPPGASTAATAGPAVLCRSRTRHARSMRHADGRAVAARQPRVDHAAFRRSARAAGHHGQLFRRAARPRRARRGRAAGAGAGGQSGLCRRFAARRPIPTTACGRRPRSGPSSGARPTRSFTRPAPAAWAPAPTRSSTRSSASAASTACASPMRRSCRPS